MGEDQRSKVPSLSPGGKWRGWVAEVLVLTWPDFALRATTGLRGDQQPARHSRRRRREGIVMSSEPGAERARLTNDTGRLDVRKARTNHGEPTRAPAQPEEADRRSG